MQCTCSGGGEGGCAHKCATHPHPPTSRMDPKLCIATMLHFALLNGITPAKHNPKWHTLIVMVLKMIL